MNPETPSPSPAAFEAKITALLLGELDPAEAASVEAAIAADAELSGLRERLRRSLPLVREAVGREDGAAAAEPRQPKLSPERRARVLRHFRVVAPPELSRAVPRGGSWLVPMAAAAAIVLISAGMLMPALSKAKSKSMRVAWRQMPAEAVEPEQLLTEARKYPAPGPDAPAANEVNRPAASRGATAAQNRDTLGLVESLAETTAWFDADGDADAQVLAAREPKSRALSDDGLARAKQADAGAKSESAASDASRPMMDVRQVMRYGLLPKDVKIAAEAAVPATTAPVEPTQERGTVAAAPAAPRAELRRYSGVTPAKPSAAPAGGTTAPEPTAAASSELAPLPLKLPLPAFMGTPVDLAPSALADRELAIEANVARDAKPAGGSAGGAGATERYYHWSLQNGPAQPAQQSELFFGVQPSAGAFNGRGEQGSQFGGFGAVAGGGGGGGGFGGGGRSAGARGMDGGAPVAGRGFSVQALGQQVEGLSAADPALRLFADIDTKTRGQPGGADADVEGKPVEVTLSDATASFAVPTDGPVAVTRGLSRREAAPPAVTPVLPTPQLQTPVPPPAAAQSVPAQAATEDFVAHTPAAPSSAMKFTSLGDTPLLGALFKVKEKHAEAEAGIAVEGRAVTEAESQQQLAPTAGKPVQLGFGVAEAPSERTRGRSDEALGRTAAGLVGSAAGEQRVREQAERGGGEIARVRLSENADKRVAAAPQSASTPAAAAATEVLAKGLAVRAPARPVLAPAQNANGLVTNQAGAVRADPLSAGAMVVSEEKVVSRPMAPPPEPQPEVATAGNPFSTFSLNVTDVSFKLAAASLENGVMPEAARIRSEEFLNAFDYRDPEPARGAPIAFAWERARYPFAHNREAIRFSVQTAARGRSALQPLNLVLLLDNSGSMERADRVQIIREALAVLARQLQPQDRISVIAFARTARAWVLNLPGNQAGELLDRVGNLTPEGGTNLEGALSLAYQTAERFFISHGINRVVLLTDGAANLGDVNPESLQQKVESARRQGIALDCFGIGWEGYNDDLLEVLSSHGDGRYGFINTPEEAATEFVGQLAGALQVAAADVKVQVEFNPHRVTVWRQVGYAKHKLTKEQFRDNTVDAAELGAAESGNALYVLEVAPLGQGDIGTVRVRYREPASGLYREHAWRVPYAGAAPVLEQSSPAMRLCVSAAAFSEWLATSPFAAEVNPDRLAGLMAGVPEAFGPDDRPKKLEAMIRQAKSLGGQ